MFIFLSKFLPLLVYPVGMVAILILVALFTARRPVWQRICLLLALFILILGGNRWVAAALMYSLEWRNIPSEDIPNADAIVLLGGGTQSRFYPRPLVEVNSAGDRIIYAAWLYRQGKAEHILVTGGKIEWLNQESSPSQDTAQLLEMLQVPAEALWLEGESQNTYENAANSRTILESHDARRIILVTSAAHMPRALALFRQQGFEVIPAPTDFRITSADWEQLRSGSLQSHLINLIPTAENLGLTTTALREYFGLLIYSLRGWL
jgi:uncharacterized SAM-binding protein YcdF (DUF218 family)